MNCPACDKDGLIYLGPKYKEYKLYRCPNCDLICWQPMKSPGPDGYESIVTEFTAFRPIWSPHSAFKKFFRDMPARGGRLLDIGCNVGDLCYAAKEAGYSVTGIDFAPGSIELARQRFPSLDFETASLEEFIARRPNDKYDVVTFIQVLEHLDNVRDFMQSVKTVLKPGGYAVCSVPNRERWRFSLELLRDPYDYPPNHFTRWNSNCLARFFESFGFSVLSIEIDTVTPFDCAYLLNEKLQPVAGQLGRKLLSSALKPNTALPDTEVEGPPPIIKFAYRLYLQVLPRLCGIVTSPLVPLLRKSGSAIYLLAQLKT